MAKRILLLAVLGLIATLVVFPAVPARAAEPAVAGILDGRDDVTGNRVLAIYGKGLAAVKGVSLQIDDLTSIGGTALLFKSKTMILFGLPTGLPKGSYIVRLFYGKALTQQDHPVVVGGTETWDVAGIDAVLLSGKAGIGTNQPQGDLHVAGVDGVVFERVGAGGAIPAEGAGARMMWYPGKSAFRAGEVEGDQWDDVTVGSYSTATGFETIASGPFSTAMGNGTIASGPVTTALGNGTTASGGSSTAMGQSSSASGDVATSMGRSTTASGSYSTAMGYTTTASGFASTAAGDGTTAQAYASFAVGTYNNPSGDPLTPMPTDPVFTVGIGVAGFRVNGLNLLRNGNLTIVGTLTQNSDARMKTDVAPLAGVLGKLAAVHGVSYRFREGTPAPAGRHIGLLAQEVREAFPELVAEDAEGKLSVAYGNFAAVLLEAVKEQQATIEAQRRDLESMAKRLELLEACLGK